jgi:hypothetical protein
MSPSMSNDELHVLDEVFRSVCIELGLGATAEDNRRRERLSEIVVSIANEGERDPAAIARRAFDLMQANEPAL